MTSPDWEHKADFSEKKKKNLCAVTVTTGWCSCLLILPLGHSLPSGLCFGAFLNVFWIFGECFLSEC